MVSVVNHSLLTTCILFAAAAVLIYCDEMHFYRTGYIVITKLVISTATIDSIHAHLVDMTSTYK